MRKILLFILLLFAAISSTFAQELTVKSFKLASSDLTAQTQPRKDLNDSNCALIKVGIALDGVKFDGSIMGKPVQKIGEYFILNFWVCRSVIVFGFFNVKTYVAPLSTLPIP